ncbi:MAG TPA: RNA polymerase sigma factor [Abditibacteriaceae bacterium]|nr:RNA polymerase sigma factor [Abditibacteriaceae bacterium]
MTIEQFGALTANSLRDDRATKASDATRAANADQELAEQQLVERQLVQRASEGEPDALAKLYDLYAPGLHRVLLAILSSPEDAEDALQETFVKLLDGRMSRARDARAYLFSSARHIAFDILRRRKREQNGVEEIAEPTTSDANHDLPELLCHLPVEQREVIALKVFQEMTFAEIAVIVQARPNTVASRYRYGIEKLRQWLREEDSDE